MSIHIIYNTDLTKPNRKRPKPDLGSLSGSGRGLLERTQSGLQPNAKQTQSGHKVNPDFRSEPVKRTRGPLYVTELSNLINCLDQSAHRPIRRPVALTNQRAKQSFSVNQYVFQQHIKVKPMYFIK